MLRRLLAQTAAAARRKLANCAPRQRLLLGRRRARRTCKSWTYMSLSAWSGLFVVIVVVHKSWTYISGVPCTSLEPRTTGCITL